MCQTLEPQQKASKVDACPPTAFSLFKKPITNPAVIIEHAQDQIGEIWADKEQETSPHPVWDLQRLPEEISLWSGKG